MIKIVAAMVSPGFLPLEKAFSLVLDSYAFLELCVVVCAAVPSVHRNEKGVELILGVVSWFVSVCGNTSVIVKE